MATYHHKDGDFEATIISHGAPDPKIAAEAILPLVMARWKQMQASKEALDAVEVVDDKKMIKD